MSDCDQARLRLETQGIASLIKNEYSANTVAPGPLGPLPFALPEIWLLDDAQMEAALDILGREPPAP